MTYLNDIKKEQNKKLTENGATALNSSGTALLDLFATSGALRERNDKEIENMFIKAMVEDKALATKLAFYTRDIRGGLGERKTARIMFKALANHYPQIMLDNIHLLFEYGRCDDLLSLLDTEIESDVIELITKTLKEDLANMIKGKTISLLAKWLPSVNTSSIKTRKLAIKIANALNMSQKEYRKTLSSLRAYLNVTEVRMSSKDYSLIKYDEVPSYAMHNYSNAFRRNDLDRFTTYLESLKKGETKINSSTLYPYDIIEKILYSNNVDNTVLEEQWKEYNT